MGAPSPAGGRRGNFFRSIVDTAGNVVAPPAMGAPARGAPECMTEKTMRARTIGPLVAMLLGATGCDPYGCPTGYVEVMGRCLDADAGIDAGERDAAASDAPSVDASGPCVPSAEVCNGVDDDCDEVIDGTVAARACADAPRTTDRACSAAECVVTACIAGYDDCDRQYANGCETELASAHAHCGGCGMPCAADEVCAASECVPLPIFGWQSVLTAGGSALVYDIAVDDDGSVYAVGVHGSLSFGASTFSGPGTFLVKLSPSGEPRWAINVPSPTGTNELRAVALDDTGNVYVTGREGHRVYVASYTSAGTTRWTQSYGRPAVATSGAARGYGLAVSGPDVIVGGHIAGQLDTGSGVVDAGSGSVLALRLESEYGGLERWTTPGNGDVRDIAADAIGNVYLVGSYRGTTTLTGSSTTAAGPSDGFVLALTRDLERRWVTPFAGAESAEVHAAAIQADGNLIVVGGFYGVMTARATLFEAAGAEDAFIATLTSTGEVERGSATGGLNAEWFGSVSLDDEGRIYVSGIARDGTTLGGTPLDGLGMEDTVVASFSRQHEHLWSRVFGGATNEADGGLGVTSDGRLVIASQIVGPARFGGDEVVGPARGTSVIASYRGR